MPDLPTRHLLISQPDVPGAKHGLAPPRSWSDEEGTAALILPTRDRAQPGSRERAATHSAPAMKSGTAPAATSAGPRWGTNLFMAALGGLFVFLVLFAAVRFTSLSLTPPIAAPQQLLIDEALFAVQTGHVDQALSILERFQRGQSAPDPVIDLMISALKRRVH